MTGTVQRVVPGRTGTGEDREGEDAQEAEFGTVADWTARVVGELGDDHALPAACRGSGSPAALTWLSEAMSLRPGQRLLDSGAGLGGPAAFVAGHYGVQPVLCEPMLDACRGVRRLFALPALAATGDALPCADGSFDAAWALGVLCTTTAKRELLRELHRVLRPGGQLGLLALVQVSPGLPEQPEGNSFPRQAELDGLLRDTGFTVVREVDTADLGPAPDSWKAKEERVEQALKDAHGRDPRWLATRAQEDVLGRLLDAGHLVSRLVHAER